MKLTRLRTVAHKQTSTSQNQPHVFRDGSGCRVVTQLRLAGKLVLALLGIVMSTAHADDYVPSSKIGEATVTDEQFSYDDRIVPLRIYLPESTKPAPVILFSHGLGGSREGGAYLGKYWAERGYVMVAMQHAGSDIDVIRNAAPARRYSAVKEAANAVNAKARVRDVAATLDHLEQLTKPNGKFANRFDLRHVGMSGHSFGAVTTQAVSGQNYKVFGQMNTDDRIKAALALSPSPPAVGHDDTTFAKVGIPWMLMTGTKDDSPIGKKTDAASRRLVFPGLPTAGHFYELCLKNAEHSAFADVRDGLRARKNWRNPNHHKAIQVLSTAFWEAYLRNDANAKAWLNSDKAKSALEPGDEWQRK